MLAERLTAQLLAGAPASDPVAVAKRLLAIQAQDPRGARLAVRARTRGLHAGDVDRALTEDRSLVVTWLNRGTLHLVRREDYPWLHALTAPTLRTASLRRLDREGVSPAQARRALALIERALADEGPRTRAQLRDVLAAGDVPTAGQATIQILFMAGIAGLAVRGPMIGREQAYVLTRDWLGAPEPVERDAALAELARRYLAGHGPADERDLARWSGLSLGAARAGLAAIAGELRTRRDGLAALRRRRRTAALPRPKLLGAFEPVLLGWASREQIAGDLQRLVTINGLFRPFALVGGRAVGLWRLERGAVRLDLREEVSSADLDALRSDARDVERFLAR